MKLRPDTIIKNIEHILEHNILPMLKDDFAQNDVRMATSLLAITRLFREDDVANKVEEQNRMRAIFADAASVASDASLADALKTAAAGTYPSLRISDLDAETGRLRTLLVELHEHVEGLTGDDARRIDRDIWRLLRDVEKFRAPRA